MLTDYELPITTTSERLLFAIESTDDEAVAKALQKWFGNESTAKRREIDGHVIWEMVENEGPEMDVPEVSLGDVPDLVPQAKRKKANQQNVMPHAAYTVVGGNLFIASHLEFSAEGIEVERSAGQGRRLSNGQGDHRSNGSARQVREDILADRRGIPHHI